jgi:hypothetical protein
MARAAEDIDVRVFRAATEAHDRGDFEEGWRLAVLALVPRFNEVICRDFFDQWRAGQLEASDGDPDPA